MNRKDERGQVLSSLVAVVAVVAIVGGLLVLFGTRGNDSVADDAKPAAQTPSAPATTPAGTPTAAPSATPTVEPTPTLTPTEPPATETSPSEPAATPASTPTDPATTESTEPTEAPTRSANVPPSQRPAVEIYNNTTRKGLAQSVGNRARQAGWTVSGADNWRGKVATSTVYYPAGMQTEAAQLAQDLGVPRIKDALDNMKKDRLTVILTTDYAG